MPDTIQMQETVVDGKTKYTCVFPLTDENGKPLLDRNNQPRITNLIADSHAELVLKIAESNIRAMRNLAKAQDRARILETRTATPAVAPVDLTVRPMTAEQKVEVGLELQDPRKAADAVQRVVESVVPKRIAAEVSRQGKESDFERGKRIGKEFAELHFDDYFACQANADILTNWLRAQNPPLGFTSDNLEIAFAKCYARLAQRPSDPPPASDAPPAPPNAPPANAPPTSAPPAPDRRPPSSGIRNSDVSRLAAPPHSLTRTQALEMLYKNRPEYERWMRDPELNVVLTKALSGR
jgi:hypothetical protein